MTVQYEFLFSVYSAPPFITEILMVLLVIVILGFPCTSYLSRYVPKNFVSPSEIPPEVGVTETVPESNELATDEPETDTGIPEPGREPARDLVESGSDDSSQGDLGPNDPGPTEPGPDEPGPDEPGPEEPGPEEPGPEEPSPEDAHGSESSEDDDFQDHINMVNAVEVNANRESIRQNNQANNTSGASHTQRKPRSVQVLYSQISNYPEFSHSDTEDYFKTYTRLPSDKYFKAENSVLDKMSLEADVHGVFHDVPGDCNTKRNEIQRGEMESLYRQQTGSISNGSPSRKNFKLHNLNAEKSYFLPDIPKQKQYDLLSHKEETSSHGNSFKSVSSSPLLINKYKRKLADSMEMKLKGIRQRSNQRYDGRNASHTSHQFAPCTEHLPTNNSVKGFLMRDSSWLKQYDLLMCKEETASQESSVSSVSSNPLFSSKCNNKVDDYLKEMLKRIHQDSNMRYNERNAPQKSQQFIPHSEHSVTDHLEKDYFVRSQSHNSKFHDWCYTIDVDDFSNLQNLNENSFFKQLPFTPTEGGDTDQEKYNYNKDPKRRRYLESKISQDNYEEIYETVDWVKNNANGHNTCYCSAEDKLEYYMKDSRHPLSEEDANKDKDPIYFKSYSHSERVQHSANIGGIGKFKSSSDVNDAESTLSERRHNIRMKKAKLFIELLKERHYKNLSQKRSCKSQRKFNYYSQVSSNESATHYPPGKANQQNVEDNNGKSISETIKASCFETGAIKENCFSSTDEEFDVHDL